MIDTAERLAGFLEETFRWTREEIGDRIFATTLFEYAGHAPLMKLSPNDVLGDFIDYLRWAGASPHALTVARFEAARYECAHGSAQPLSAAELQNASLTTLLAMQVRRHPFARLVNLDDGAPEILTSHYPQLVHCAGIVLLQRANDVLALPVKLAELAMLGKLAAPRNLFAMLTGAGSDDDCPSTFHRLLKIGLIVRALP